MPRPKLKKGLSVSTDSIPIQFPSFVWEENIWEILNVDDLATQKKVMERVEGFFTVYPSLLVFLDDAPRPTAKLAEITPLLRAVKQASKILGELSDGARLDIGKAYLKGIPKDDPRWQALAQKTNNIDIPRLYRIREDLKEFIPQLEATQAYLQTCSSQGGKVKGARQVLTAQLRQLFETYFHPVLDDTNIRELQVDFIQTLYKAYNKLNLVPDKLPTDKRAIRSLLGPAAPSPESD